MTAIRIRCSVLVALIVLAGCASPMTAREKQSFESALDAGDYKTAAALAKASGNISSDGKTQNLVWSLNAGSAMFDSGETGNAIKALDASEQLAQGNDLNSLHAAVDYHFTTYDGVMTNVYKAMAFLAQHDRDNARVELKRAEDRQRRAEEHFQKEIAAATGSHSGGQIQAIGDLISKAQQSREYADASANLNSLAAYAPFENPFATYVQGIFLLNEGEYGNGIASLKRASQILGPNSAATADLIWADHMHQHGDKMPPQIWVVFENGQSATYHELRIILPMVTGQPMTLALPTLAVNAPAYTGLQVIAGGTNAPTMPAGSFDAVMASEFAKRRPLILEEAVAEVVAKNAGALLAQKSDNLIIKIGASVAANISTADTRSWVALPKEFQVARISVPADGHVSIQTSLGALLADVTVPTAQPSIVWVKAQAPGAHPAIMVLPL